MAKWFMKVGSQAFTAGWAACEEDGIHRTWGNPEISPICVTSSNPMVAWLRLTGEELLAGDVETLVGHLVVASADRGFSEQKESMIAWRATIQIAKAAVRSASASVNLSAVSALLEYEIPRRPRRIDLVLLIDGSILVVEVKAGAEHFDRAARLQVLDYQRDLRDFHAESQGRLTYAALMATGAGRPAGHAEAGTSAEGVLLLTGAEQLASLISKVAAESGGPRIDPGKWDASDYRPTPGIIEAAVQLYEGHDVREISHAWADNLSTTVDTILGLVGRARDRSERLLIFVTGVPGSGKTLAGLSAIHKHIGGLQAPGADGIQDSTTIGAYLSGNGPLVSVLQYALTRSMVDRTGLSKEEATQRASTLIQPVHLFRREHADRAKTPPENVIVFDEAQRAWSAAQMLRKEDRNVSEAETLLSAMGRVPDWSVVVALVGEGQEIGSGEAGLAAWVEASIAHRSWSVVATQEVAGIFPPDRVEKTAELHLSVSVRSPRARSLARWTDAVLAGQFDEAALIAKNFPEYPILVTRDLEEMRLYLRDRSLPDQRTGLLASSQARRLRPFGIEMNGAFQESIDWPKWFVEGADDLRSSYSLEVAASEFKCQGLEIDWAGLCWGDDLLWDKESGHWLARRLRGSRWVVDSDPTQAINRYRVLLTRGRSGIVIWVPSPKGHELLVDGDGLNTTFDLLQRSGAKRLI